MKSFSRLAVFKKELKRLLKKYRTLEDDLDIFEKVLVVSPTGIGRNFTIIHSGDAVKIVKARIACRALKDRSLRIVYVYFIDEQRIEFIEIYFKGDKENEDRSRVKGYIK